MTKPAKDETEKMFPVVPEPGAMTSDLLKALRAPFPPEEIGNLPRSTCKACSSSNGTCETHPTKAKCGVCNNFHSSSSMHIDYVGHADVTARLLQVDPFWTWDPMARDATGMPILDRSGGLWITLTVLGVSRPGYGNSDGGKGPKEAIGDAIRNAAMRFGVALDLWAKGDREWAGAEKHGAEMMHPDDAPEQIWQGPSTAQILTQLHQLALKLGVSYETVTAKWRNAHGGLSVDDLVKLDPRVIHPLLLSVQAHAARLEQDSEIAAEPAPEASSEPEPAQGTGGSDE